MSMMCPPQRVKIVSTPSFFSALATRWPPEMTSASRLLRLSVSSAVVELPLLSAVLGAVSSITASISTGVCARKPPLASKLRAGEPPGEVISGAHVALFRPQASRKSALFQVSARGQLRRGIDGATAETAGVRTAHRLQNEDGHQ